MPEDYPETILELEQQFSTEESCRDYLIKLRWPNGIICPKCDMEGGWIASRGRVICPHCRYQGSVTAGTIFEGTRKPLVLWFRAIWLITSQKHGASALNMQQILGLGSYVTAWVWLHKLRRAMVRPNRERLQGEVEVDETYVGGKESNVAGRKTETKSLVAIAVEKDNRGSGRIRLKVLPSAHREHLHHFIQESVQPGSLIHTDGLPAYRGLENLGYQHKITILVDHKESNAASRLLPRVHRIASLLKRWLLGTHQGSVSPKHLDYYLDEFTFRFNRRKSCSRGKLFYRLLQQAVQVEPFSYKSIAHSNISSK